MSMSMCSPGGTTTSRMVLITRFDFDPAMIRIQRRRQEALRRLGFGLTLGSLQIQNLLLRWCFCQKIIHLQRTIPPNLIGIYLEPGFTHLKKLILNSILGRADGIFRTVWRLRCL